MQRMLLFCLLLCLFPVYVFAGVGDVDNRYYVTDEMWATHPYNKFVILRTKTNSYSDPITKRQIYKNVFRCTGQYVSKNLILSAAHCIEPGAAYEIRNYNKESIPVSLVSSGNYRKIPGFGDWAVWKIDDPKFYNDDFFDVEIPNRTTPVINAGFGWMRILSDEEIKQLRIIFREILKEKTVLSMNDVSDELDARAKKKGIPALRENDKLKACKCNILLEDCSEKMVSACQHKPIPKPVNYPYVLASSCDSWAGNSGGGYVSTNGKALYGTVSYGIDSFYDKTDSDYLVSSRQYIDSVTKLKKENAPVLQPATEKPTEPVNAENTEKPAASANTEKPVEPVNTENTTPENSVTPSDTETAENTVTPEEEIAEQENIVNDLENSLNNDLASTESMSDKDFLNFLDNMVRWQVEKERLEQLKKAYEQAKEKEQSLSNRALTALTTAATGIGGMQLAQGLAEQSADKSATADMAAYIETMRCTYGDGKQVKASAEEIELPGANDQEMMNLRAEYLALAQDLKERKEALGMKPGIESEEILDRASSGLYDDESIGITGGNYASLYRAQMLESEADQAKIDDAASTSKNRVMGGAIAAGAGVVVGVGGNYLINGKSNKAAKDSEEEKLPEKNDDSAIDKLKSVLGTTESGLQ